MKRLEFKRLFVILVVALFIISDAIGQAKLAGIFGDGMVLQRDIDIPIWGTAVPGSGVNVSISGVQVSTSANDDGNWDLYLPKMKAGGPFEMQVACEGSKEMLIVKDILIGDVWVASGQSNMEWEVWQSMNAEEEMKNANYPDIRLFEVEHNIQINPVDEVAGGSWSKCDSASVHSFSAAAYFFARDLYKKEGVPIGVIQSTWGGTPVETWTSREMLLSSNITHNKVLVNDSITPAHFVKDSVDLIEFWDIVYNPKNNTDNIIPKEKYNDSDWGELTMPSVFKDWGWPFYEGMVWMRKDVDIPKSMTGKDLTINLGHPEMNYTLYFNGHEICKNVWNAEPTHSYTIPENIVHKGNNVISIRIAVLWTGGGINPPASDMYITDGKKQISLAGNWKFKKDLEDKIPSIKGYQQYHSFLFNGMINPIVPYGITGFIWYQGEHNVPDAYNYRYLFPNMINDWRIRWKQGYLPFIFVQLANFMKTDEEPAESNWALLRESQTATLLQPNTGMACIIDIGEAESIHPLNKQEVGRRLAMIAGNMVYGDNNQISGPVYKDYVVDGNNIIIEFTDDSKELNTKDGGKLMGFAIAGIDSKFYWADAEIVGTTVVVSSESVENPVAVRYAWGNNPVCNLVNESGLPALPFRTDSWCASEKTEK